jgi:predicted lactoylglutathione lyase
MQFGDEEGGFTMYGTDMTAPSLAITRPYDGQPYARGNGYMVAMAMDAPDKVDAFYGLALALGGSDEGAPGYRGDPAVGFYAGYFRDPDGHKFAAFCVAPQAG